MLTAEGDFQIAYSLSFVQPGDDNGSINQNHGRVFRSNSAPEILPSQLPARARMWRWASLREPDFLRTRMTPLSWSVQRMTVPGPMPACSRMSCGMVLVPLLVHIVSDYILEESYFH